MKKPIIKKTHWQDSEVEAHWDRVADIYIDENDKVKETHDQRFREAIAKLNIAKNDRIINITSRDCEANDYLLKQEAEIDVLNAEISAGLMRIAKVARPYVKQVKIDNYSSLPFENSSFERVLCLETLEHVAEPLAFLAELHRISTADTRLVLSCPPLTCEPAYRFYTKFFGGHGEGPHRFLPSKEVKEMFRLTGWKLLEHRGTILFPVGPKWFLKFGEYLIDKLQWSFVSELGIRQFYVCEKY